MWFNNNKGKGLLSCENKPFSYPFGGDKRDRTADLLNAIQALSQLSYTPSYITGYELFGCQFWAAQWGLVIYSTRSQLSYTPSYITGYELFGCQFLAAQWGLVKYGTRSQLSYTPKPAQSAFKLRGVF